MIVAHLTASPFFGGPERQMLGLAAALPPAIRTVFLCFHESGMAEPFIGKASNAGFETIVMRHKKRGSLAAIREVAHHLRDLRADVLCTHGYKPDLLGLIAGRKAGVPVVGVSRGWTAATLKVRAYEALDRLALRWMDRVVCVSAGQAEKVRRAGVQPERLHVIRNAIRTDRFNHRDPDGRRRLQDMFKRPPRLIVGAAGRLSPEKGYALLVDAAARLSAHCRDVGFVLLGDGPLKDPLLARAEAAGLSDRFILPGFRDDLDQLLPHFDVFVLPSYTEGLPNVVLEAFAASVPVVATAVGGTPEVVDDDVSGFLVPSGDVPALAERIGQLLSSDTLRRSMGSRGRKRVEDEFTFAAQAGAYQRLFHDLVQVEMNGEGAAVQQQSAHETAPDCREGDARSIA